MKRLLVNVCANSLQTFNLGDKDTIFFPHTQIIPHLLYKINKFFPSSQIGLLYRFAIYRRSIVTPLFPLPSGRDGVGFFRGSFAGLSRVFRGSHHSLPSGKTAVSLNS